MTKPDIEVGKCPISLADCSGVELLEGEQAREHLGPFYRAGGTALVCRYHKNPLRTSDARTCEATMEGGVRTLEDAPVE